MVGAKAKVRRRASLPIMHVLVYTVCKGMASVILSHGDCGSCVCVCVCVCVSTQIVVEEGPGGRKENAATHLTSIVLLETQCSARHVMATDTQPDGLRLTLAIHHACVRDLQAAIEHSRVIAFQTPEQTARMQRVSYVRACVCVCVYAGSAAVKVFLHMLSSMHREEFQLID